MNFKGLNGVLIFRVFCIVILCVLLIRGCILPGIQFAKEHNLNEQETVEKNERYKTQYLSFFKEDIREKLLVVNNYASKTKSNYLELSYNQVSIFIHRIDLNEKVSFNNLVVIEKMHLSDSPGIVYSGSQGRNVKFLYSSEPNKLVERLIISYDMSLENYTEEGDSLINVNYIANSSTFRYGKNESANMVFTSVHDGPIHFNAVVLNKNKYAVIIVAIPVKEESTGLGQSFIKDILNVSG